ncbi:MAG: AAA family ATPase [bacterium]
MSIPILTFFNNTGGVGKTSLVYHLAWMFASLDKRVLAIDLDPQANLTSAFLNDDKIEQLWDAAELGTTIYHTVRPLTGVGDIAEPVLENIAVNLYLLPGDIELSAYEEVISNEWPSSMNNNNLYRPMRILSSFWQTMQKAAQIIDAEIILVDIGPNLGAINRSVLISTDYLVIPLGADLFSLQGLRNLGPTLRNWKILWERRLDNWRNSNEAKCDYPNVHWPEGKMQSIGYLCQQPGVRLSRPIKAYDKWFNRIPSVYRESILNERVDNDMIPENDSYCLGTIKHYRSLVPMAQEHRKPIFNLTSADGAIGSHANAVTDAKAEFRRLARVIAEKIGVSCVR